MTTTLHINTAVIPRQIDKLTDFLKLNLPNTRAANGCLSVRVKFNADTNQMVIDEVWTSIDDHQAYVEKISQNGVMDELLAFLDGEPSMTYYQTLDV